VAKNKEVPYKDEVRFDAEFKKRQSEINNEILIWLQSELFRSKVLEVTHAAINDHDELVNLSKRLFENGIFTSNFKELTKKEFESNSHKTRRERFSKWLWLVMAAAVGSFLTFFFGFLEKKCF